MVTLQSHPICERVSVLETKVFSYDQFFLKVRAELTGENKLQVRIYYNQGHIDYAYQLFTNVPILLDRINPSTMVPTYGTGRIDMMFISFR